METKYFVSFEKNGEIKYFLKTEEAKGRGRNLFLLQKGIYLPVATRSGYKKILFNSISVTKLELHLLADKFERGVLGWMGKPVTKETFNNPQFLKNLGSESNLVPGEWVEKPSPTSKVKSKYTLLDKEGEIVVVGYSTTDSSETSKMLVHLITSSPMKQALYVHNEAGVIVALINKTMASKLSFTIETLE